MSKFGISDIRRAAEFLSGHIVQTPLLASPMLDAMAGCKVFVKAECLQTTGSFKFRGALNKILSLSNEERRNGVIAFSAGNHGQGLAAAAKIVGCPSVIIMPTGAAQIKVENCRWWGAEVVFYDPEKEDRQDVTRQIAEKRGMTLIHPFDDYQIIAGQGTVGLEICDQMSQINLRPDAVIVNCSGGGLSSGVSIAIKDAYPDASLCLTEIAGFEKWRRSLSSGQPEKSEPVAKTVMDGINGPLVGTKPLAILLQQDVRCFSVADEEALSAVSLAFRYLKIVVEPAGAASLAALLRNKSEFSGKTVVVVCSGGNVDPAVFVRALS